MSVTSFYGRWADLYDRIANAPGVARWRRAAVDALELSRGDTVVEMGCGTGANLPHLRRAVGPSGRVVGLDITRPLLERARDRADRAGWSNVSLLQADMRAPPVREADAVLGTFVCGMVEEPAAAVESWCELAGGVALLEASSSEHPVGRLLAPAFGAFVGAGQPADSLDGSVRNALSRRAVRSLDDRVAAAREALTARTVERRYRAFGLGYVGLLSGRVA